MVTSPDKSSFAFVANKQVNYSAYLKTDIYISPISANTQSKALTDFPATFTINISQVGWSPDGTTLAFTDTGDTCLGYSVYTVSKAGGKSNVVYNEGNSRIPSSQSPLSYAPGGKWLTYGLANCLGNFKVVLLDTEKGGPPIELVDGNNPSYGRKIS